MTALKVLLVLLLLLFLLSLIRVGGVVEYSADGLTVKARVGAFRFQVLPGRKKEKPPKEKAAPKKKKGSEAAKAGAKPEEDKPKAGGPLRLVKAALPLVGEAAGALKRRIRIDRLLLRLTLAGAEDAAGAAMNYGYANMLIGMIWPIFAYNFEVKDYHLHTAVDFQAREPTVWLRAAFSARVGQVVSFALRFGIKFFKSYQREKKRETLQKG